MKIKNLKVFVTSALIFAVIGTLNACRDNKLNNQNSAESINNSVENIKFEGIFIPAEDIEIDLKPTVCGKKTR